MTEQWFSAGEVIKLYGVYRCGCGTSEIFGISGRRFPRSHCDQGGWRMIRRMHEQHLF